MQFKLLIALVFVTLAAASPAEVAPSNEIDSRSPFGEIFGPKDVPAPAFIPGLNKIDEETEEETAR